MQLNIPADVEALVQKQLATGAFADEADVIRRALETLEAEGTWTDQERRALDDKIDRALEQVAAGQDFGPVFSLPRTPSSISTPSGFTFWRRRA